MVMFVKVVILFCIGHVATCGFAALNDNRGGLPEYPGIMHIHLREFLMTDF